MGRSRRLAAAPGHQSRVTSTDGEDEWGNHRKIIYRLWMLETLLAGAFPIPEFGWYTDWQCSETFMRGSSTHFFLLFFFFFYSRGLLCLSAAASEKQHGRRHTAWCLNPRQTSVSLFFSLRIQRNPCSLLFLNAIPILAGGAHNRRVLPLPISEELWVCRSANSRIISGRLSWGDQWGWEDGLCSCLSFPALHTPGERRGE